MNAKVAHWLRGNPVQHVRSLLRGNAPLLLILALAAVLRLAWLRDIPFRVDGDAARLTLEGIRLWQAGAPILGTGWMQFPYVEFYAYLFFVQAAGDAILGTRLLSASGGIATVLAVYFLGRRLCGERIGALSALVLSVLPFHLVFSRNGLNNGWPAFYASLSLYLLPAHPVLAGALAGVAQYSYHSAILIPILLAVYALILKRSLRQMLRVGAGFLITFGPLLCYFARYSGVYAAKIARTTIFRPDYPLALDHQLFNNFLAFHLPVALNRFYYVYTPYLGTVARVLFTVGLLVCAFRLVPRRRPPEGTAHTPASTPGPRPALPNQPDRAQARKASQLLLSWLVLGVLLGGVLVRGSPTPHRFAILLPAVAIVMAMGLDLLYRLAARRAGPKLATIGLAAVVAVYVVTSLSAYWQHDTRDIYLADFNTQVATYVGRFMDECRHESHLYFLGDARADDSSSMFYDAVPTLQLLTREHGTDVAQPFDPATEYEEGAVFVLLPRRLGELPRIARLYPNCSAAALRNPLGRLLAYVVTTAPLSGDACSARFLSAFFWRPASPHPRHLDWGKGGCEDAVRARCRDLAAEELLERVNPETIGR